MMLAEGERWRVVQGDCLAVMRGLPDGCVDAVVTDPPYGIGKAAWDGEDWELLRVAANECARLMKPNGICFWFGSIEHLPKVIDATSAIPYRWQFIWYAPNNMQHGDLGYCKYTSVLVLAHGKAWRAMQGLRAVPIGGRSKDELSHPTEKPIGLMTYLAMHACEKDALILDPFMGSGTTGVACMKTGRRFLGIEIDANYCRIAAKRIADAAAQLPLPLAEVTP